MLGFWGLEYFGGRGRLLIFRKEGTLENNLGLHILGKKLEIFVMCQDTTNPFPFFASRSENVFCETHFTCLYTLMCVRPSTPNECVCLVKTTGKKARCQTTESTFLTCSKIRGVSYKACRLLSSDMWDSPLGLLTWKQHGTFGEGKCWNDGYEK